MVRDVRTCWHGGFKGLTAVTEVMVRAKGKTTWGGASVLSLYLYHTPPSCCTTKGVSFSATS